MAHQIHQPDSILNNHFPVSPGEDGCQKSGDLDVLLQVIAMRDRNRIGFDEMRSVVQGNLLLKKFFYFEWDRGQSGFFCAAKLTKLQGFVKLDSLLPEWIVSAKSGAIHLTDGMGNLSN